jgi:hypothetical protein
MPERFLSYTGAAAADMGSVVVKPESPNAYTQTFSTAARTQAEAELPTNISATLITELNSQANATNKALNEIKKLVNGLVDDLQATGIIK